MRIYKENKLIIMEPFRNSEKELLCEIFDYYNPVFKEASFNRWGLNKLVLEK